MIGGGITNTLDLGGGQKIQDYLAGAGVSTQGPGGVTGSVGIGQVGSVTINPSTTAPRFDSTLITLDSTTDTFDEG